MRFLHGLFPIILAQAFAVCGQITWQTTSTADYWGSSGQCKLESNTIHMIIHPFFLDIEEEAVISTQGQVQSGDPNTLEIDGQFTLTPGSAVRSMLVWNGNALLKAKLREKRMEGGLGGPCPAIIQKIGDNTYQFKIYPVAIGLSGKLRILYSVPLTAANVGPQFTIKTAFTYGCAQTPPTIPIEFDKAANVSYSFVLTYGAMKKTLQSGATYLIPIADLVQTTTDYWGNATTSPLSLSLAPDSTSLNRAYQFKVDSTNASGWYAAIFAGFPDTLSARIKELQLTGYTAEARVITGDKSYISDIPYVGCFGVYLKSTSAWDRNIYWSLYKDDGTTVYQMTQAISPDTSAATAGSVPLAWACKYNLSGNTGNYGALFGFVDDKMDLVALENDSLSAADVLTFQAGGVPPLLPSEIFVVPSDMPVLPAENAIFEYSPVRNALQAFVKAFRIMFLGGNRVMVEFGKRPDGPVSIVVVDMSGRLVYRLERTSLFGTSIGITLPSGLKGVYLMRVMTGKMVHQQKFVMK